MMTAVETKKPPLHAHPAHWVTMKYMLLAGRAVVRIYLVLRLILEHKTNERTANAVA